jgi:hypothetical protein
MMTSGSLNDWEDRPRSSTRTFFESPVDDILPKGTRKSNGMAQNVGSLALLSCSSERKVEDAAEVGLSVERAWSGLCFQGLKLPIGLGLTQS